jgi:hypothetical protein
MILDSHQPNDPTPDRALPPSPLLFAELGWPEDANWVQITCDGSPTPSNAPVPVSVRLAWPIRPTWSLRYCIPATLPGAHLSRYAGYRFELLGLLVDLVIGPAAADPPLSLPWPWCWRETGVMRGTEGLGQFAYTVQLWRQRAWYRDSPLCAELRWHPLHGEHHGIVIPADYQAKGDARQRALTAADRGLRFLEQLMPPRGGGRPPDFATAQDAETALTAIVQAIRRDKGREATQQLAAEYLDDDPARRGRNECDPRQVDRYLARFWTGDWESWVRQLRWPE